MPWREVVGTALILMSFLCAMSAVIYLAAWAADRLARWADRKDRAERRETELVRLGLDARLGAAASGAKRRRKANAAGGNADTLRPTALVESTKRGI